MNTEQTHRSLTKFFLDGYKDMMKELEQKYVITHRQERQYKFLWCVEQHTYVQGETRPTVRMLMSIHETEEEAKIALTTLKLIGGYDETEN